MIDPVLGSVEAWLAIYFALPLSIRAFINLSLLFFLLHSIVNIWRFSD